MDPIAAQMLLLKCQGDEIWDAETCRAARVPQAWVEELKERFESGFDSDRNSIYVDGRLVNQYEGISDLHLACKIAEHLGIDWRRVTAHAISRTAQVDAIKAEIDEL